MWQLPPASSSNFSLVEVLCVYFTKAFKSFDPQGNATPNSSLGTPNTTNTQAETIQRSQVDILRALSAVLFENGALVRDVSVHIVTQLCAAMQNHYWRTAAILIVIALAS